MPLYPGTRQTDAMLREDFVGKLLLFTGDTRMIWSPKVTDTTSSTEVSLNGRAVTHGATLAGRLSALGLGYAASFNGSTDYSQLADNADFTHGDSATDTAFSVVALINVNNTATAKTILSKDTTNEREYRFYVQSDETLRVEMTDNSVPTSPTRTSNAAITTGAWTVVSFGYSGGGGATNMNNVNIIVNGTAVASTAANSGTYVAMENKAAALQIGARTAGAADFFDGSIALVIECAKFLSLSEQWALSRLIRSYFGLST